MIEILPIGLEDDVGRAALQQVPGNLRGVLGRVARCFRISSALAPGLILVGGELALTAAEKAAIDGPGISATGSGLTLPEALTTFLGEAADLLSQFERSGDIETTEVFEKSPLKGGAIVRGWIGEALAQLPPHQTISSVGGKILPGLDELALPADFCLRRPAALRDLQPIGALSSGCAAGPTVASATERAVLELVERDAAALWWYGGKPPCSVDKCSAHYDAGMALLSDLRRSASGRITTFLDISTDLNVPVFAAVSMDRDGMGFACGLGSRLESDAALGAAVRELCQMELAAPLSSLKSQARGASSLTLADQRHLQRAAWLARDCQLLAPTEITSATANAAPRNVDELIATLHDRDVRLAIFDLTREDIAVPVIRVVSPDLQPFASAPATARLTACVDAFGGGAAHTSGIPLI